MSFPQLLRRSSFAQHDPLITRIYTSTQSSISQTGDWGLKYPIHRPKGPKYIKVTNLDAGSAVGADWRSGEKEARFTEAWGTGRVRWQMKDGSMSAFKRPSSVSAYDTVSGDEAAISGPPRLLPDVESMTPAEFERYVERIRERRKEFLPVRLGELGKETKDWREDEGDFTLINLAIGNNSTYQHGTNMQASLLQSEIQQPSSNIIDSRPHPIGGLYYSQPITYPPSSTSDAYNPAKSKSYVDPRTTFPGRALNRKNRLDHTRDVGRTTGASGNNAPYIISIGGVTAEHTPLRTTEEKAILKETDYTRTRPEQGVGRFEIKQATLRSLPTILNLKSSEIAKRYGPQPISKAKRATPLDTMTFKIDLGLAANEIPLGKGKRDMIPGSREWVGRERGRAILRTHEDGLGAPKYQREKGAALRRLNSRAGPKAIKNQADEDARTAQESSFMGLRARMARQPQTTRQQ